MSELIDRYFLRRVWGWEITSRIYILADKDMVSALDFGEPKQEGIPHNQCLVSVKFRGIPMVYVSWNEGVDIYLPYIKTREDFCDFLRVTFGHDVGNE